MSAARGGHATFRPPRVTGGVERLLILFGDQLDLQNPVLRGLNAKRDVVLMMEVAEEATHVPSHKQRTTWFLAAMRHFAVELVRRGTRLHYITLNDSGNAHNFTDTLRRTVKHLQPTRLDAIRPGDWRVMQQVEGWSALLGLDVQLHEDAHFYLPPAEFPQWAADRKTLVLEHFYRMMRRRFEVLVDAQGAPEGGHWNYDADNRAAYDGITSLPKPRQFRPDEITREVMELVDNHFSDAPGTLDDFVWPVTRREALAALRAFIDARLPSFGKFQDAMVAGAPWMFHSLLSPALNLKLLNPREVIDKAVAAYHDGKAPLNSVEGFVRQILGWREFMRGIYWHEGPDYAQRNALEQVGHLPELYWTGRTDMRCLAESVGQVLQHGYGHHIQRLMVTGNFALIAGVHPREVSDWYLGMYVDAVDWVTLPNTLGMVMFGDGGVVATKPYAASGQYLRRMSDYCDGCRYDPRKRIGDGACPFSTFYWDFLMRNERRLRDNRRMQLSLGNLKRLDADERAAIGHQANALRTSLGIGDVNGS